LPRRVRRAASDAGPRRAFIDSGGWIALFSARDAHHAEANRLFREAATKRMELLTTNLVLAEVHRFLLFRAGTEPALRSIEKVEASKLLRIIFPDAAYHRSALRWLARFSDQEVSYTDAVSFSVMERMRCRAVVTFDRDFVVAGFTPWRMPR
jgi:hypothetical protein